MFTYFYKSLVLSVLTVIVLLASSTDVLSQQFIMQTGGATYNATCGAVIKMKSTTGTFVNNGGNTLGITAAVNAIPGVVDWAAISAGQTAQGLYYELMVLSGAANKNIADGVYITGGVCATSLAGYDFSVYPFYIDGPQVATTNTFAGTFHYIGTTQTVFPVSGDDPYNNLDLSNGAGTYTIADNLETDVNGTITLPAGNTMDVLGDLFTGLIGIAPVTNIAGTVTVNNAGTINVRTGDLAFDGSVTVTDGSIISDAALDGTVIVGATGSLSLAATTGILNFASGTDLEITGSISNSGDGTNLDFDCLSTVTYNSAVAGQLVLPTLETSGNSYGNLTLLSANKTGGTTSYGDNVNICTNLSVTGPDLDMRTHVGSYVQMLTPSDTNVTYAADEEVLGGFRRKLATAVAGTEYIYNNHKTSVDFATVGVGTYYQLFVNRDASPNQYVAATDVNRKVVASYDFTGMDYTLKVGYLTSENPTFPTVPGGLLEADLKFFEADFANTASEKVAGVGYGRDVLTAMHSLSLGGLLDGADAVDGTVEKIIASGNDVILRANNTMVTILDGRWSNPNVWDEGRIPQQADNVEIRTMIYVGIDGPFAGTIGGADDTPTLNTRAEAADYTAGASAANTITIGNYPAAHASLIVGNEDNGAYTHKTFFMGTSFVNNNTTAPSAAFPIITAKNTFLDHNGFNGLWITNFVTGLTPGTPAFGTEQLQNSGAINNQGIIEIGH
jgi:hypothetical protein